MAEQDSNLPILRDVEAQLEPYKAGGLIESAISAPERSMDRMITTHLATVAMLEARGDKLSERPTYIFNPDSRLLINYALRRDKDPAKSGLFADVVELDDEGKPRYGVDVVNPFATSTGFINVAIGDNPYGFAPSYTEMKLDSDDPLRTVPPNIDTADLLAMLSQQIIPDGEELGDFVARRSQEREEFRAKVRQHQTAHYLGTEQAFDEHSNPDMHLIIADRDEADRLAQVSREVGLYPLLVTGDELLDHYKNVKRMLDAPGDLGESIRELLHHTHPELFKWLGENAVSFVTIDVAQEKQSYLDSETQAYYRVETKLPVKQWNPETEKMDKISWKGFERSWTISSFAQKIVNNSSVFARVINAHQNPDRFEEEQDRVTKIGHGAYEHIPITSRPESLQQYQDWLRKVRLDMALTLYLRGLNQIG